MTFARIENGNVVEYPIYEGDIKLRFPNTSFTFPFSPPEGFVPVTDVTPPAINHEQNLVEETPIFTDGEWKRNWTIVSATTEQIAARTAVKEKQVRAQRNSRLAATDWTQSNDSPLNAEAKSAWAFYREVLRMVPEQPGFPWNVSWPPAPGGQEPTPPEIIPPIPR